MTSCCIGRFYGCPEVEHCEAYRAFEADAGKTDSRALGRRIFDDTGVMLSIDDNGELAGCVRAREISER